MELWALDQFEQIDRITTQTKVEVVERDLDEGGWMVELPLGDAGDVGAALLSAAWPGIELFDPGTGWRFGGYLTDWTIVVDGEGVETLRLVGKDFQSDLAAWLEWPESTLPDEWWANTYGGFLPLTTDCHNMVGIHAGPSAASGRSTIFGLTRGVDPAGGTPKGRRIKGEPMLDVMRYLLAGTDWTARLRLARSATGIPSMLFETPARPIASVVLNVKRGTVGRMELTTSAAEATWVLAMGAEVEPVVTAGERWVGIASTTETSWQNRHREVFLNRPATDSTSALGDEALNTLNSPEVRRRRSAKVDSARVDGWGRDIDLGWLVDVQLGATFSPSVVRLPVAASTLTFSPAAGWVRTVDVGVESLSGPAAVHASIARARAQIRQIENDIR